jgi:hypothetical protein
MKYLLLLFPLIATAGEAELACKIQRNQAEVQATILESSRAFGSVGQDASTGKKTGVIGISKSFAGERRARLLREAADQKCMAINASLELDELSRWSQLTIIRSGAVAELSELDKAIAFSQSHIKLLDAQLAAQVITINQHNDARQTLVGLEMKRTELLRTLSTAIQPVPSVNAMDLASSVAMHEGNAAELLAQASAEGGWDIVIAGGARQEFGGKAAAFATITATRSFGLEESRMAAVEIGRDTKLLAETQQGGYAQVISRQADTVFNLLVTEAASSQTIQQQIEHLKRVRTNIQGVDTALAQNTLRGIDLQLLTLQASRAGSAARTAGYANLLGSLK